MVGIWLEFSRDSWDLYSRDFMGFSRHFMGFRRDFMGFSRDLMGLSGRFRIDLRRFGRDSMEITGIHGKMMRTTSPRRQEE